MNKDKLKQTRELFREDCHRIRKKFIITCPYCGKELFKSRVADADIKCYKCGAVWNVEILDGEIVFHENIISEVERLQKYHLFPACNIEK